MYIHIYCLHVFAMLFTGPFQPERYVCFVLPKNKKNLPSGCGFCWDLCQPSQDMVSACLVQRLPAQRPPEIMRDVPAARETGPGHLLLHSLLVSVILTFRRQKLGMSLSIGEHWGQASQHLSSLTLTGLDSAVGLCLITYYRDWIMVL